MVKYINIGIKMKKEGKKEEILIEKINQMREENQKIITKLGIEKKSYLINVKRNIFGWLALMFVLIIFIILIIFMVFIAIK